MPRAPIEYSLLPSILDRLIDRDPKVSTEPQSARSPLPSQIKDSVKRDLEWLLNSKQLLAQWPEDFRHLERSLLTYGLPDFSSSTLSNSAHQDRLRRAVEQAIAQFEPRLSRVSVTIVEGRELDRSLRFRIDAMLRVDPAPEPVTFDSVLQLSTRAFVVQGE
jgi:type VI secretion system protein ImpF